ncbi:YbhB/YbcL family Raf kinase inhibitor-like protein [Craterilacuibacter sp.]|uniref:YbhB/YbcL family Raf kinase inhibitor-like protein n=1 Tax=Craterilacuibacter sp. TaxID=2870909 RepID=UPI003F3C24A5
MQLFSDSFQDGDRIPGRYAFAVMADSGHIALSANINPQLRWQDAPAGTRSFALICHDPDVPSRGDDVNQEGRVVPADLPRTDFFHWLLLDIPSSVHEIAEGSHSAGITPRGKAGPQAPDDMRHGLNDYTGWNAGNAEMAGDYYGYDGPCPPWNDARLHHYVFTLYALDTPRLVLGDRADGAAVLAAIRPHSLASASLTGSYSLNPALAS